MLFDHYRSDAEQRAARRYGPLKLLGAMLVYDMMANATGSMVAGLVGATMAMGAMNAMGNAAGDAGGQTAATAAAPLAARVMPQPSLGMNMTPKFDPGGFSM